MSILSRRIAIVVAALLAAVILTACSPDSDDAMTSDSQAQETTSTSGETAPDSGREDDVIFAQMMIPHHEQAVEMADMALDPDPSSSVEVRELAVDIKAAQDPEIETMRAWLEAWGASQEAPSAMDHDSGMMSQGDMGTLASAEGAEFDQMWLTMMIEHHEGAIIMAQDVLATTDNAEVATMAEDIVAAQEAEIATMQALLEP
ncbi:DUF305 domain-containing protein [Nostocoides sp. F2B08]|uniref:DUF305 domain-containing protein n=1 Tax=Nostocoides sp. F2B08 TaxID=2653936 RepID=UPI001262ECC7|nr:DUF305 domain-containing protein [Tetrasphaera sp. F2B08]KAB7740651.1 DUF305 domain-containing protein [Tetrasphaera sp. F2B08]